LGFLSGGQLQRVLIAWALAGHPDILLFDEPTTGVDLSAEESIYSLLKKLQDQESLTLILISHELQVVYRYATNVLCLNKEGLCYGPPHQALTQDALSKLFGEHTSIYHHQHQV
jgi:zinc transport system ATP-binding protein